MDGYILAYQGKNKSGKKTITISQIVSNSVEDGMEYELARVWCEHVKEVYKGNSPNIDWSQVNYITKLKPTITLMQDTMQT